MPSIFQRFKALLPTYPVYVASVVETDGVTSTVEMPGGQRGVARGTAAVGSKVFVQDGAIQGEAPSLPLYEVTV